jgi:hypothetical protein
MFFHRRAFRIDVIINGILGTLLGGIALVINLFFSFQNGNA